MSAPKRILAIHAHPDDVEFLCAGTLALLAGRGHRIDIATMSPGDCGSAEEPAEAIAARRRQEAQAAAAAIGAQAHCLEFRDLQIVHDNPSRRRVTEFLRQLRPDLVLTAPPSDYMADHELTSRLVRDACFNASVPNYATEAPSPAPPLPKVPHLYYMDAIEGIDLYGDPLPVGFLVDVTATYETKRAMLACHDSQRAWLRRQHGVDEYLETQRRWSRRRGWELGVEHAEGFRQHKGHAYPNDDLLRSLLNEPS